jgi:membrane protease YdiL (CAAX protease family)
VTQPFKTTDDGDRDGRRRRALAALCVVLPAPTIGALATFWLWPGPIGLAIYTLGKAVLYGTPAIWSRFVDREPWVVSKPDLRGGSRWFAIGIGFGLLVAALIVLVRTLLGDAAIDVASFRTVLEANGLADPVRFLLAAAWFSFGNALLEEYVFRWFITSRFERLTPRTATWWSAAAFTAHHIVVLAYYLPPAATVLASAGIFVGGLFWSWLTRRAGSIWPAYVSHAIVDIAIMAVGYIALFGSPFAGS